MLQDQVSRPAKLQQRGGWKTAVPRDPAQQSRPWGALPPNAAPEAGAPTLAPCTSGRGSELLLGLQLGRQVSQGSGALSTVPQF